MLDLPGGRLAYYRFGEGPDVFAIHGWPLHAATFRGMLPRLAGSFSVHLVDLPGAGHTRWGSPGGMRANLAALREAIEHLGLRRYALVAHDSGGMFARSLAASDPRVAALVLMGTEIPGHHPWQLAAYVAAARLPRAHRLLGAAMQVGAVRRSALGLGGCFRDPAYADGEFAERFLRPLADPAVMLGQMGLLRDFDPAAVDGLAAVHARIRAPTLCVWGERDPFFPVAKARAMLPQFAGGATLEVIPGARLFVHEDHADVVAALAAPFLERTLRADGERATA
jgi:pimeloyl-ACP methyl ester carboxylesterase